MWLLATFISFDSHWELIPGVHRGALCSLAILRIKRRRRALS